MQAFDSWPVQVSWHASHNSLKWFFHSTHMRMSSPCAIFVPSLDCPRSHAHALKKKTLHSCHCADPMHPLRSITGYTDHCTSFVLLAAYGNGANELEKMPVLSGPSNSHALLLEQPACLHLKVTVQLHAPPENSLSSCKCIMYLVWGGGILLMGSEPINLQGLFWICVHQPTRVVLDLCPSIYKGCFGSVSINLQGAINSKQLPAHPPIGEHG